MIKKKVYKTSHKIQFLFGLVILYLLEQQNATRNKGSTTSEQNNDFEVTKWIILHSGFRSLSKASITNRSQIVIKLIKQNLVIYLKCKLIFVSIKYTSFGS